MRNKLLSVGSVLAILLFSTFMLAGCSSDEGNGANTTVYYKLFINNGSKYFTENLGAVAQITRIANHFNLTDKNYVATDQTEAQKVFSAFCDSVSKYDWLSNGYDIADSTTFNVNLIASANDPDGEGTVILVRKIQLTHYIYGFVVKNVSSAFGNNIVVVNQVNSLISIYNDSAKTYFDSNRATALSHFTSVCDTLQNFNWKSNIYAITKNTYFTLCLVASPSTTIPGSNSDVIKSQVITLPTTANSRRYNRK